MIGEFIRLNLPGMKKMSSPTVGANNAGELIRRYSPVVRVRRIVAAHGVGPNVGITPVSPDVVEYTQVLYVFERCV